MVQFFVLQISCNVCIPLRGQCWIGHSRHRADEYGVFLMNFALSYGYFQSALEWLRSILLAHFWYVRIMLSSIRDYAGEKYSLEILSRLPCCFSFRFDIFYVTCLMCSHFSFLQAGLSTKHPSMGWSIFQAIHFFWKKMHLESVWICLARQVCDNQCRHWRYRHIL